MQAGPTGFEIGAVTIGYFGLIVTAAAAVGVLVTLWRARSRIAPLTVLDAAVWIVVGAVLGGRLFYVLNPPPSVAQFYDRRWFLSHPLDLQAGPLAVWNGGLGSAGVMLGGLAAGLILLWRRELDLGAAADALAPGVLLALAVLPWANLATGQLLGPPTGLPWAVGTGNVHPTPAYASLWAVLAFGLLWWLRRGWLADAPQGALALAAALLFLPGVFLVGFLQVDVSRGLLGLSGGQWMALALWAAAAALAARVHAQPR